MSNVTDGLVFLWSSQDEEVARNMMFMYLLNSKRKGWWDEVTLVVWGPSAKLLSEDQELQEELKQLREEGVTLEACKACADRYGVSSELEELGIDVQYIGEKLTAYIKEGRAILSL